MATEENIEKVRQANDIVDVIGEYFPLKKAGSNYKALCPFHQEKTPSFVVSPQKQLFHCFGCGESGNIYNFFMKIEGLDFPEALERLAERVNVNISEGNKKKYKKNKKLRETILGLNNRAAEFYHRVLLSSAGKKALNYLENSRNLEIKIIKEFKIGYAPGGDFLTRNALENGISEEELLKSGLSDKNSRGGIWDKFRQRIIFPIQDERGQVRGFGARVMDPSRKPKYLNTAQTPVFEKKQIVYGLYHGKKSIRENKRIILLEGYMDVIAAHQAGIKEAVAALGTAITEDHIYKIKHWVNDVILALDSDFSGMKAAEKGVDLLAGSQIRSKVCVLPEGSDPEDIIRDDRSKFLNYIQNARDGMKWRIERSIEKAGGKDTPGKKAAAVRELIGFLQSIGDDIKKEELRKKIAEELEISEESIMQVMRKNNKNFPFLRERLEFEKLSKEEKIFREILHLVIKRPDLEDRVKEAIKYKFENSYSRLLDNYIYKSGCDIQKAILAGEKGKRIISRLSLMPLNNTDPERYLDELLNALTRLNQEKRYRSLSGEIKELMGGSNSLKLKKKNKEFMDLARALKGCGEKVRTDILKGQ